MTKLTIFRDVEWDSAGAPIVVTSHLAPVDLRAGDTLIQRYSLRVLEQLRDHALRALQAAAGGSNPSPVRGVRTPPRRRVVNTTSVEDKVRDVWAPGMSVSQLERAAGISRSSAGKYVRLLSAVDL